MKIGKREQIVLISIGTLAAIALIHTFIFKPRAEEFARVENQYKAGNQTIQSAEVPASDNQIQMFNIKTKEYQENLTSVVASLNLNVPEYYTTISLETVMARIDDLVRHLQELNTMRNAAAGRSGQTQLTFMNDRRANPQNPFVLQEGWNLPPQLPGNMNPAALWDTVKKLDNYYTLLQAIQNPIDRLRQRLAYNQYLTELGINPAEVSNWVINLPGVGYVFFNDSELVTKVQGAVRNPLSTDRFGVVVPDLKRAWMAELIWAKREPSVQMTRDRLYNILEMSIQPDHLLVVNRQLASLVDLVKLAQQNSITEIQRVNLLKPSPIGKGVIRVPGQTPTPTPSPTPMAMSAGMEMDPFFMDQYGMGMGEMATPVATPVETIGQGSGLEIWFRAPNSNTVKFLFDVTHVPRTYALDDLNIDAMPDGQLITSTTVELVSTLDSLSKKQE